MNNEHLYENSSPGTCAAIFQSVKKRFDHLFESSPRGNGVMDSALDSHGGGQGSIPVVGVYSNVFFSLSGIGARNKLNPDTLKWCSSVYNK